MPTVLDDGNIQIDDITGLLDAIPRDTVTDLMVNRRANRLWVRLIPRRAVVQRSGYRALHVNHVVVAEAIQLSRCNPSPHMGRNKIQNLGRQSACRAHGI